MTFIMIMLIIKNVRLLLFKKEITRIERIKRRFVKRRKINREKIEKSSKRECISKSLRKKDSRAHS